MPTFVSVFCKWCFLRFRYAKCRHACRRFAFYFTTNFSSNYFGRWLLNVLMNALILHNNLDIVLVSNFFMHLYSFFVTASLCKYIFNLDDLTNRPQWQRSAYNRLARMILKYLDRIFKSAAVGASDTVAPFSKQEFFRIFCHEFCYWRCDREEDDVTKIPIVWDTLPSRMLHPDHFGQSVIISIPGAGSVPTMEDTASPGDRERLLAKLGDDQFITVCCNSVGKNVFRLLTAKMILMRQIESRPADNVKVVVKKTELVQTVVGSDI